MSLFLPALARNQVPGARRPDALAAARAEAVCEAALACDMRLDGVHTWGDGSVCLGFGDERRRVAITVRADAPSTQLFMDAEARSTRSAPFDHDHLRDEVLHAQRFLRAAL